MVTALVETAVELIIHHPSSFQGLKALASLDRGSSCLPSSSSSFSRKCGQGGNQTLCSTSGDHFRQVIVLGALGDVIPPPA